MTDSGLELQDCMYQYSRAIYRSIKDLIDYRLKTDSLIEELVRVDMPTKYGHFTLAAFKEKTTGAEHLALVKGSWQPGEAVEKLIAEAFSLSPALLQKAKAAIELP